MGSPSFGDHPMKKWLHAQLLALDLNKYDASKWMFINMLKAWKQMVTSRLVARYSKSCLAFAIVMVAPLICLIAIKLTLLGM